MTAGGFRMEAAGFFAEIQITTKTFQNRNCCVRQVLPAFRQDAEGSVHFLSRESTKRKQPVSRLTLRVVKPDNEAAPNAALSRVAGFLICYHVLR
jgi:hypothetical protein